MSGEISRRRQKTRDLQEEMEGSNTFHMEGNKPVQKGCWKQEAQGKMSSGSVSGDKRGLYTDHYELSHSGRRNTVDKPQRLLPRVKVDVDTQNTDTKVQLLRSGEMAFVFIW